MSNIDLAALTFSGQVLFTKTYGWYEFCQNNSGGHFQVDDDVSVYVLIQAASPVEANTKAKEIGIYFDGCREGRDCDCCGDRWGEAHEPLYGFSEFYWKTRTVTTFDNVRSFAQAFADRDDWAGEGQPSVIVYFADGSVERFYRSK